MKVQQEATIRWVNTPEGWVGPIEIPGPYKRVRVKRPTRHAFWGVFVAPRKRRKK